MIDMLINISTSITIVLILTSIYYLNRIEQKLKIKDSEHHSINIDEYVILDKEISNLVDCYFTSQILPLLTIDEYTFSSTELQSKRDECIKYVLEAINTSPIKRIKDKYFSDYYIALKVDMLFLDKLPTSGITRNVIK